MDDLKLDDNYIKRFICVFEKDGGLVTRNEWRCVDSTSTVRRIAKEMNMRGYLDIDVAFAKNDCCDMTYAIYDTQNFTHEEVVNYLKMNVLTHFCDS